MKALVLAAGEGTRLRPLTSNVPKPLLLVAGKPFLSHIFGALQAGGVREVALLVGWKANRIKEFYGNGSELGLKITYLEQKERMGTADAVGHAEGFMDEPFFCVNGDVVISELDVKEMRSLFEAKDRMVMGAVTVPNPSAFGVIEEKDGKLVHILEKPKQPPSDLINAGMFVFTPEIFQEIRRTGKSPRGEYEITDTLTSLARSEGVMVHRIATEWIDVGRPWDLLKANEIFMSRLVGRVEGEVEPGAMIKGDVVVEKGALVRSGSYVLGPAYISKGCEVGPNCYIRGGTCLGPNVKVGASVEVKNSIIMAGSHVPHHNYVGDSIIGERCNLGAGTKVANLRFDDKNVKVSSGGRIIDTGRRKLGVIMGDNVKTGINSMIDAGTIIWEDSFIGPGAMAKGSIGPGSRVY
jgi:UDP-N-acetylglucosamine diphosphorylase / glucose-1-phosphate thymidylyltransferase / UDP-N-acetylgalactosamine diphosphorylase / glucosamine-1-phosphate N-acetyltransferase / galactosamine-1-phosphate N-acetyltransferase